MLSFLKNLFRKKSPKKYLKLDNLDYYIGDINVMKEYQDVLGFLDFLVDKLQGGKDVDGNAVANTIYLNSGDIKTLNTKLTILRMDCLKSRGKKGFTAVQNAMSYLGFMRKGKNQIHILLIVKALLETGFSTRGGVTQELNKFLWQSSDGRWLIKKEIVGSRAFFDIYLKVEDAEILALRCSRKGDAEEVIKGNRQL